MRGLLSGAAWGFILGGATLAGVSLVNETPAGNAPPAAPQVTAPQTATTTPAQGQAPTDVAAIDDTAGQAAAPRVTAPDATPDTVTADTAPAALPTTEDDIAAPAAPPVDEAPTVEATAEDPVLPNPQSVAPQVPVAEDDLIVATAPADPPAPQEPEIVVVEDPAPDPEPASEPALQSAPAETTDPTTDDAPEAPTLAPTIDTAIVTEDAPETPASEPDAAPDTATAPQALPAPDTSEAPAVAETTAPEAPETDTAAATEGTAPDTPATPETDDTPIVVAIVPEGASALPSGDSRISVNRPTTDTTDPEAETDTAPAVDPAAPAITRYGMQSDNPQGKPSVSVVLIDDGSFNGAVPAVAGVPFPVTVMLNPSSPDATEKMTAYRAAGIEVGVLANLPEGAQPSDIEIFFEAAFAILPETTAVLDPGGVLAGSGNEVIAQTIAAVGQDGRGLVTVSRGLNATLREAERADVPASVIYRDLDSEDQDPRVIRRFMDQAAFRARQESGVVLLGRIRADTISALILWGTANRAGQVALVPISNVLIDG